MSVRHFGGKCNRGEGVRAVDIANEGAPLQFGLFGILNHFKGNGDTPTLNFGPVRNPPKEIVGHRRAIRAVLVGEVT